MKFITTLLLIATIGSSCKSKDILKIERDNLWVDYTKPILLEDIDKESYMSTLTYKIKMPFLKLERDDDDDSVVITKEVSFAYPERVSDAGADVWAAHVWAMASIHDLMICFKIRGNIGTGETEEPELVSNDVCLYDSISITRNSHVKLQSVLDPHLR